MKEKLTLNWEAARTLAEELGQKIKAAVTVPSSGTLKAFGVPRGGCNVVGLIPWLVATDSPFDADVIIDDIIDSGKTRADYSSSNINKPFFALIDQQSADHTTYQGYWIVFPWEISDENEGPEENIRRVLTYLGENPDREGLRDTPKRFLKMMSELTQGLRGAAPEEHLNKMFTLDDNESGMSGYDGIIMSAPLPFVSLCEHHLAAFDGHAFIGYLPGEDGRVVGLSKIARLLDGYAQRPQVQERLTIQIADAIERTLKPEAVGVVVRGRHTCQCFRGVKKEGRMVTSAMRGIFRDSTSARAEFMSLLELAERGI